MVRRLCNASMAFFMRSPKCGYCLMRLAGGGKALSDGGKKMNAH
jgi:hypothetical protein